jgi:hypothetical protein
VGFLVSDASAPCATSDIGAYNLRWNVFVADADSATTQITQTNSVAINIICSVTSITPMTVSAATTYTIGAAATTINPITNPSSLPLGCGTAQVELKVDASGIYSTSQSFISVSGSNLVISTSDVT